jgi:CMP/dCMP kinase
VHENLITIDGPSASGKGTVAQRVAEKLGFHYLDSGALYRLVALASQIQGIAATDGPGLAQLASRLKIRFWQEHIWLDDRVVDLDIRAEAIGELASVVASHPQLRAALLDRQRAFFRPPGLVADGRDMSTVVFPDAGTKIFLLASVEVRAARRYEQLRARNVSASMSGLLQALKERDMRDAARQVAPLRPAKDARLLDSSGLPIEAVVERVLAWYAQRISFLNSSL